MPGPDDVLKIISLSLSCYPFCFFLYFLLSHSQTYSKLFSLPYLFLEKPKTKARRFLTDLRKNIFFAKKNLYGHFFVSSNYHFVFKSLFWLILQAARIHRTQYNAICVFPSKWNTKFVRSKLAQLFYQVKHKIFFSNKISSKVLTDET